MKNYFVEMQGTVTESLSNSTFRVQLEDNSQILCDVSRQLKKNYIPVFVGDYVKVASRSYAATHGCITECIPNQRAVS